jgi:glycosyltransferase involved in cell wall biosynthesis
MFTNTYLPLVGGVARSVSTYAEELRRRGHEVWIVAPQFAGAEESTAEVLRTPALRNFNGSDFSLVLPQPGLISEFLDRVQPELLHSHHPFQLGDTALRAARTRRLPLVFTHHTLYEQYTHYVPLNSEALRRVVVQMATEYANLCTHVIAPSPSIAELLVQRGVVRPITTIPTGIDLEFFGSGDSQAFRREHQIPPRALVVGHVGRLAAEKNLDYLARAVGLFLHEHPRSRFVVVGAGDRAAAIQQAISAQSRPDQLILTGSLSGTALASAYAAMNVFVFSSQSETQGMVLAEAMAARTPVLALEGPGVRDVVNHTNGRLLPADANETAFAAALAGLVSDRASLRKLGHAARRSVRGLSHEVCASQLLEVYDALIENSAAQNETSPAPWEQLLLRLEVEWKLLVEKTSALSAAVTETSAVQATP